MMCFIAPLALCLLVSEVVEEQIPEEVEHIRLPMMCAKVPESYFNALPLGRQEREVYWWTNSFLYQSKVYVAVHYDPPGFGAHTDSIRCYEIDSQT